MTTVLEVKEQLKLFYSKFEAFILPVIKFAISVTTFFLIRSTFGYNARVSTTSVCLILALICSILPFGVLILLSAAVILADLYTLSLEVCLTTAAIFLVIALLYLRFSPKTDFMIVLTPICFVLHIPYIMPAAGGLLTDPTSAVSILCGTFLYYFLKGIRDSAPTLAQMEEDSRTAKVTAIVNQITGNREMMLLLLVFALMVVIVYVLRRLAIRHAWTLAIIAGFMVEFVIMLAGFVILGLGSRILYIVLGNVVSVAIAFLLKFLFFHVDYKRTERVQFEDDDYYYYVRAVPKIKVPAQEKQVKKISGSSHSHSRPERSRPRSEKQTDI